jgi:hypothetical protein
MRLAFTRRLLTRNRAPPIRQRSRCLWVAVQRSPLLSGCAALLPVPSGLFHLGHVPEDRPYRRAGYAIVAYAVALSGVRRAGRGQDRAEPVIPPRRAHRPSGRAGRGRSAGTAGRRRAWPWWPRLPAKLGNPPPSAPPRSRRVAARCWGRVELPSRVFRLLAMAQLWFTALDTPRSFDAKLPVKIITLLERAIPFRFDAFPSRRT